MSAKKKICTTRRIHILFRKNADLKILFLPDILIFDLSLITIIVDRVKISRKYEVLMKKPIPDMMWIYHTSNAL